MYYLPNLIGEQDAAIAFCYKTLSSLGMTGRLRIAREVGILRIINYRLRGLFHIFHTLFTGLQLDAYRHAQDCPRVHRRAAGKLTFLNLLIF